MKVDQPLFLEVLLDALSRGQSVRFRVQGVSMLPWLPEGRHVCVRPAAGRVLRRGDIALFLREPGRPILHRVVRVLRDGDAVLYVCLGDSEHGNPERVPAADVMGVVETTALRRWAYRTLHPARRRFNRLFTRWGLRLRHG